MKIFRKILLFIDNTLDLDDQRKTLLSVLISVLVSFIFALILVFFNITLMLNLLISVCTVYLPIIIFTLPLLIAYIKNKRKLNKILEIIKSQKSCDIRYISTKDPNLFTKNKIYNASIFTYMSGTSLNINLIINDDTSNRLIIRSFINRFEIADLKEVRRKKLLKLKT